MLLLLAPLLWSFYRRARSVAYQHEALMRRAVEASTQERRRIAATLHDGVVQQLAGTSFTIAGQAQRAENQGDQQLAENLAAAAATVRDSVAGMRSLLVDIYPPSLGAGGAGGFAAALSDLTKSVSTPSVQVRLNLYAEAAAVLNSDQQQAIFRVAQECLRNAAKHAKASTIVLSLTRDGALVTLEVADDGTGFDLGSADQAAVPGHFGLQLMADAAETVDAALSLWSSRDRGTLVRMEIVTS
jgi:signal transduction histidine kinase